MAQNGHGGWNRGIEHLPRAEKEEAIDHHCIDCAVQASMTLLERQGERLIAREVRTRVGADQEVLYRGDTICFLYHHFQEVCDGITHEL